MMGDDKSIVVPAGTDVVMLQPQPRSLVERLLAVKAAIGALGKEKRMEEGPAKYQYRSIDAILESAHEATIEHGVLIAPVATQARYEQRQTRSGGTMTLCLLDVSWLVKSVDGEQLDPLPATCGEALDTSDKATNKAHTAAYKVLLSQLYSIPYSEPDHDAERIEQGNQRRDVEPWDAAVEQTIIDSWSNLPERLAKAVLERLSKRAGREVESPTDLPSTWREVVESMLKAAWEAAERDDAQREQEQAGDTADRERMEEDKT